MQIEKFLDRVESLAEFESRKQVEESVAVSLAALGERLYRTNRRKLAAQLPDELKVFLEREVEVEAVRQDVPPFSLEEYYKRVAARADMSPAEAMEKSRKVMVVLTQAVTPEILSDILEELPEEYKELFGKRPDEPSSVTAL